MELSPELKAAYIETAKRLKGYERRLFMARIVKSFGLGGPSLAERELGWGRKTIRKGLRELETGIRCLDASQARGRKRAEVHLPGLLDDIRALVDGQSQTDPTFQSQRLYTRLSAAEVRRQLIALKGYTDEELPSAETIRVRLNELGYRLRTVRKSQPQKNSRKRTPSSTT
jgi:hypothetical protein